MPNKSYCVVMYQITTGRQTHLSRYCPYCEAVVGSPVSAQSVLDDEVNLVDAPVFIYKNSDGSRVKVIFEG